jgi:alkanesulfonate monooxygenase SsuD/methylene tetrahydromethanopterin reductase-like flavin-dependent oxidoreductase (luciferase family)
LQFYVQLNPQVSLDKPTETLLPTMAEQVRTLAAAGFEGFSMGEHYNIPGLQRLHQIPFLARLAAEAPGLAVGTAVSLVGLRHPVALASEIASHDVIAGGNSFFGFGLGYRQQELDAFELTKSERLHRFVEGVEIIKRLFTEDHVSFEGNAYHLKDVTVDPKPIAKPRPPIWIAANKDPGVARAARLSDGWMIGPHSAIDELRDQVALCRRAWREAGKEGEPAIPIIRETFVAPTREEALAKARPCLEKLYQDVYIRWGQHEAMGNPEELTWDFDKLAHERFILGSPEECIEQIRTYQRELGTTLMFPRFDWTPGLSQADVLAAMRLFGEEVLPHVRD